MHDEQERGTWSDSEAERLLRAVLKYSKQYIHDKGKWLLNQITLVSSLLIQNFPLFLLTAYIMNDCDLTYW